MPGEPEIPKTVEKKSQPPTTQEKQVDTAPGHGDGHVDTDTPCCCSIILFLEKVTVIERTDAGWLPFGITADHVFFDAIDCAGKLSHFPSGNNGIKLDSGQSSTGFEIATVTSDPRHGCDVHCNVTLVARKKSVLNALLDRIAQLTSDLDKLFVEAAQIAAQITSESNELNTLLKIHGPVAAAVAALQQAIKGDKARLDAVQARIDAISKDIDSLLALLAGTDDTLMFDLRFLILGRLPCGGNDWISRLREPRGWKADAGGDPDRATLHVESHLLGGHWALDIAAIRKCPQ